MSVTSCDANTISNTQNNNIAKPKPKSDGPINFYEIMYRGFEEDALKKWFETKGLKICPICETQPAQPAGAAGYLQQLQKVSSLQPQIHPLLSDQPNFANLKRKENELSNTSEFKNFKRLKSLEPSSSPSGISKLISAERMAEMCIMNACRFYPLLNEHLVTCVDENGSTLLHHAIRAKKPQHAEAILRTKGCNINQTNFAGNTPLHIGYQKHHFKLINLLLENGAKMDIKNKGGFTPEESTSLKFHEKNMIKWPVKKQQIEPNLVRPLISTSIDKSTNFFAKETLDNLCKLPIDEFIALLDDYLVTCTDLNGSSLLHYAVAGSAIPHIKAILGKTNCNVNHINLKGNTALHIAFVNHDLPAVVLLLKHGASMAIKNHEKMTPEMMTDRKLADKEQEIIDFAIATYKSTFPTQIDSLTESSHSLEEDF